MNPRKLKPESRVIERAGGSGPRLRFSMHPAEIAQERGQEVPASAAEEWPQRVREQVRAGPAMGASPEMGGRHQYLDDPTFAECLNRQMREFGTSLRELARRSWLDIGYVSRLVNMEADLLNPRYGEQRAKHQPSRDAVIRLGLAMNLPIEEMDELLLTAGFAPLVR